MPQFRNDPPGDVPGYVYFVRRETGGVKIGSTRDWPTIRIISTSGLHTKDILLVLETHSCRELEKELHRKLRPRRIRRRDSFDTFDLDKALLERLANGFATHKFKGEPVWVTVLPAFDVFGVGSGDSRAMSSPIPQSASGRRTRGQYVQLTFRLPDVSKERLERMAAEAGVSQEDLKRWLVWRGLQAWDDGERPEVEAEVVRRARMEW